jgi:CDP-diacylglycerol---serine O-phosphatidyltransferase
MKAIAISTKSKFNSGLVNHQFKNLTIPNLISYFTLTFSLCGIYLLLNAQFFLGAILLWTACDIFDTLDGYVARRFKLFSPLGADLDSLIDVIAFLIPPFLISLQSGNSLLLFSAFIFVFAGIYRLARFNVEKNAKNVVVGLQASLAAHLIYSFLLMEMSHSMMAIIYTILSVLMISPIKSSARNSFYLTMFLILLNITVICLKIL